MRIDRHHLLEIILWPNSDGTFRKIINTKTRLRELGIYDDWKLTITIPADEHTRLHCHNRPDEFWDKVSQSMSIAKTGEKNAMYGKKHSAETKEKMSKAQTGEKHYMYGKTHSDATKAKMSAAKKGNTNAKGAHWYNNGIVTKFTKECPDGFVPGRLRKLKH